MEKLISLAQVEQLIDEMNTEIDREELDWLDDLERGVNTGKTIILKSFKSKLSSLPTQESGWIALDSLKMKDGERLYIKREGDRYLCNIEGDTGYGFCTLSLGEAISKLSIKPLPKPPLQ